MPFLNSLQSEWLKLRNSAALWLIAVGGFFIPSIILISRLIQSEKTLLVNASEGAWMQLFHQCWQYMSIFLLPMGITLVCSLIAQVEYRNNAWKQVFASPQSLHTIFWAKYSVVVALLLVFFVLFNVGIFLTGAIPPLFYSDIVFPKETFPFRDFIQGNATFFIHSLPILALQYGLSLHIRNFIIPISVGFALLIAALIAMGWSQGYWMPYTYVSMQYLTHDNRINPDVNIRAWALGYFCLFTLSNYIYFVYKNQNMPSHFLKKSIPMAALFLMPFAAWAFFSDNGQGSKKRVIKAENTPQYIRQFEENLGFTHFKIREKALTGIEARMKNYDIKGLSIAVIHNYKIAWAKAYGWADAEAQIPMTTETLMQPGSISKAVNALAFMKLYQEKKIDLFEDVNQYLTSWQFPYNQQMTKGKKITLAQLLSHSAGLNIHGFGIYGYAKDSILPTALEIVKGVHPAKNYALQSILEPGKQHKYSGGGTMLSQLVLTDFTKQAYDACLLEQVLKPLGMTRSFFTQPPPKDKIPLIATGYTVMNNGNALHNQYRAQPEQAAAGLWTTPADLANMIIHLQKALRGDPDCLLSKRTARLMLTPYNSETASMGFFIDDKNGAKYFQHGAGNPGFSGKMIGSMEGGNGVVVLVNSDDDPAMLEEVIDQIADIYGWEGFTLKPTVQWKNSIVLSDSLQQQYTGAYQLGNTAVTIEKKDTALCMYSAENSWPMYFTDQQSFINIESKTEKKFVLDETGQVTGIEFRRDGQKQTAKRLHGIELSEQQTQPYTGQYTEPGGEIARIYWKDNRLWVHSENMLAPAIAHFIDTATFYLKENGGIFEFKKDKNGKITGVGPRNSNSLILTK